MSEAVSSGAGVNVYLSSSDGVVYARNADNSSAGKQAIGFVRQDYSAGQTATVYFAGVNDQCSELVPGATVFISDKTPGLCTTTVPAASGSVSQPVGTATTATSFFWDRRESDLLS
jgi:hypothetical protein